MGRRRVFNVIVSFTLCLAIGLSQIVTARDRVTKDQGLVPIESIVVSRVGRDPISLHDSADVIVVNFSDINEIAGYALSMVDNGALIYISAPEIGTIEISQILGIPLDSIPRYNNVVLLGTHVSKIFDLYVWGHHYANVGAVSLEPTETDSFIENSAGLGLVEINPFENDRPFSNAVLLNDMIAVRPEFSFMAEVDFAVNSAISAFENHTNSIAFLNQMEVVGLSPEFSIDSDSTILPGLSTFRIFTGSIDVWSIFPSTVRYLGSIGITKYIYDRGSNNVNNVMQRIFDGITVFTVSPGSSIWVSEFTGRMHSNITGHTFLQAANLPSGSDSSTTVSLSSAGPDLAYSFNPRGMNISRTMPDGGFVPVTDWRMSTPFFSVPALSMGTIREMSPAFRMATPNHAGARGIFSSVLMQSGGFGAQGIFNPSFNSVAFEVGSWF